MPKALTELEQRVLDYLFEYLRLNTYQPSVREIGAEFSIKSTKTVSELLQSLADKGWVERDPSRSRGVRLLGFETSDKAVSVPFSDGPDTLLLDRRLVGGAGVLLFRMDGDHLRGDGITAGDLLLIKPVDAARVESGDLLLAVVAEHATVRRCARESDNLVLDPIRDEKVSITLTPRQAANVIRGRVSGVIRRVRPLAEHTIAVPDPAG
ncbi:hypothetical protein BH23GEM10_BH23GEM10_06870 [soil metagenome]